MFERTVVPRDFDLIEVPYRERGEPQLVRWKDWRERNREPGGAGRRRRPDGSPGGIAPRCYTRAVGSFNPVQRGQEGSRLMNSSRPGRPATPHDVRALGS